MYLFILESLGTQELILIGIVALILLGPRRLPEIARKAGKIMSEFRGTANEFRETWSREIDLEKETKAFSLEEIEKEVETTPRSVPGSVPTAVPESPMIKAANPGAFDNLDNIQGDIDDHDHGVEEEPETPVELEASGNDAETKPKKLKGKRKML